MAGASASSSSLLPAPVRRDCGRQGGGMRPQKLPPKPPRPPPRAAPSSACHPGGGAGARSAKAAAAAAEAAAVDSGESGRGSRRRVNAAPPLLRASRKAPLVEPKQMTLLMAILLFLLATVLIYVQAGLGVEGTDRQLALQEGHSLRSLLLHGRTSADLPPGLHLAEGGGGRAAAQKGPPHQEEERREDGTRRPATENDALPRSTGQQLPRRLGAAVRRAAGGDVAGRAAGSGRPEPGT